MKPRQRFCAAAILFLTLSGCAYFKKWYDPPSYGTVNIAVTMVAPWEEYVADLTANFPLSAQEALSKVIPRTGILEEKLIDSLGLTARLGLPQSSESLTRTTTITDEETSTKEEKVEKKTPGEVPQAGKAPGSDRALKDLAGAAEADRRLAKDPILEYTAATALYQEVKLLNRYVTDAALRHNMKPYIVRLQVGSVPFTRDQGYDLYTKIGFFPKDKDKTYAAYVLPLLVTDNLEGMLTSRAHDIIRQLSVAVTFMKSGIGGAAGVDRLKEDYRNEVFSELNSLFTVGRVTNNTIAARFGAVREGKTEYTTIPRTHNVTLVLMVPSEFIGEKTNEVRVVARTTARSASTGEEMKHQGRHDRQEAVADLVQEFVPSDKKIDFDRNRKCTDVADPSRKVPCTQAFLEIVWMNDFDKFHNYLKDPKEAGWYEYIGRFERDLWMDIADSMDNSHYAGVRFQLPNSRTIELPKDNQTIFLVDDGKTATQATLVGGVGLNIVPLGATLTLQLEEGHMDIAGTVTPGPNGSNATVKFPSLVAWKIGKLRVNGTKLTGSTVGVYSEQGNSRWEGVASGVTSHIYPSVYYQKSSEPEKPAFSMRKTADWLAQGQKNENEAKIYIEFAKVADKRVADLVEISVEGGVLKKAQFEKLSDAPAQTLPDKLGKVTVTEDGTLLLTVGNLHTAKKVTLRALAKSAGKPVGGDHPPIELEVVKN
ncbi:MAG: hypothetical protein NDI90_08180 [Nitrospira sp. BO4]|jgi:hypothetical protein|nr:hypothetical protein [Nitrospira sp. BO4]